MNKKGFTYLEVIISVVLMAILASGFFMMIKANSKNLVKGYEVNQSNFELNDLVTELNYGEFMASFELEFLGIEEGSASTFSSSFSLNEYQVVEGSNYMLYFKHE